MKYFTTFILITLGVINGVALADDISDAKCRYDKVNEVKNVYPAKNGIILYESELHTDWKSWNDSIPLFKEISESFNKKGIQLIILPVPTRTMVNPEILRNDVPVELIYAQTNPSDQFSNLIAGFKQSKITVVDLLQALRHGSNSSTVNGNYFQQEFHWTQSGALIAAQKISDVAEGITPDLNIYLTSLIDSSSKFEPVQPLKDLSKLCNLSAPALPYQKISFYKSQPWEIFYTVFSREESSGSDSWRWFLGPKSAFSFVAPSQKKLKLNIKIENSIKNQIMRISFNGKTIYTYDSMKTNSADITVAVNSSKGVNTFTFDFSRWNHKSPIDTFAPKEPRTLAMNLRSISLTDDQSKPLVQTDQNVGSNLLDEKTLQITVIGTSYAAYMNLANLLEGKFKTDVLDESIVSGGVFESMQTYLSAVDLVTNKPKVVVWEMPMMWTIDGYKANLQSIVDMLNR